MIIAIMKSNLVEGPVRKIGIQSRSLTGTMPNGNRYESSLERDLMILLEFDPHVKFYTPQPITIRYRDKNNIWHKYIPDGLIEYYPENTSFDSTPVLVEVKYRNEFVGKFNDWVPKFRAANQYAKENGWIFKILTDDRIRTPFLKNVKFLTSYKHIYDPVMSLEIEEKLRISSVATPQNILNTLFFDKWNQAKVLPIIWGMVARRELQIDLSVPITMNSRVWMI